MYGHLTEDILNAPTGPHIGAFFDLDRTLLEGFSVTAFMQQRLLSGNMPPRELQANLAAFANYTLGKTGLSGVMSSTTRALRGVAEKSFRELGEDTFVAHLRRRIYPEARALVEAHRKRGHTLAIISAATRYQIAPVARELGIEHVLCTELAVEDGVFTGEIVQPPCWKEGKAIAARRLADGMSLVMEKAYFYTDAAEDLPLLELVGNPHPLNPDRALAHIAEQRGWPVHHFTKRKSGANEAVRTALAYGSVLPATLAGMAVRALTGSSRRGADVTTSLWADLTSTAVGLDVRIIGREHLWSHRPAIFIFNHQSQADAIIMARLVREQFTGVAKIEASRNPVLGPFMKSAGMIFIDRADRAQALQALAPAVEALKTGTSLVIAPEGTRSETGKLLPFKKGAFHMAIQAGVPIVPVVLHNALDVQPKGEMLFRPATVYVEVLKPIDTADWRAEDLDARVAAVREQYLQALGQEDAEAPVEVKKRRGRPPKAAAAAAGTRKPARPAKPAAARKRG